MNSKIQLSTLSMAVSLVLALIVAHVHPTCLSAAEFNCLPRMLLESISRYGQKVHVGT